MLPRVKIIFQNGALGLVAASADGVLGVLITGAAVVSKFDLAKAYTVRKASWLTEVGITLANNPSIYKFITEYYSEAPEGTELWLMAFPDTVKLSDMVDKDMEYGAKLLRAAKGRLSGLIVERSPGVGYVPTITNGIDADVAAALVKGQALSSYAAETLASPIFIAIEGYAYGGDAVTLTDLHTMTNRNCMVMIGDTVVSSKKAAMGLLAGRIASRPLQQNIGRVRSGALSSLAGFIGATSVGDADIESIHNKGYITFRTIVRKAGFFFNDDFTATSEADDYSHLTHLRTINKAARIAYDTMSEEVLETIDVNADGTMQLPMAKSWQQSVERAISTSMAGQLSRDKADPNDRGVKCFIDTTQNVVSTSRFVVNVSVRPFGYARYIDIPLGFEAIVG